MVITFAIKMIAEVVYTGMEIATVSAIIVDYALEHIRIQTKTEDVISAYLAYTPISIIINIVTDVELACMKIYTATEYATFVDFVHSAIKMQTEFVMIADIVQTILTIISTDIVTFAIIVQNTQIAIRTVNVIDVVIARLDILTL